MLLDQECFNDPNVLEIGDTVRIINSAYIKEIRGCIGIIISTRPVYFPSEDRALVFYKVRITKPRSADQKGYILGGIGHEISSPSDGLKLLQKGSK